MAKHTNTVIPRHTPAATVPPTITAVSVPVLVPSEREACSGLLTRSFKNLVPSDARSLNGSEIDRRRAVFGVGIGFAFVGVEAIVSKRLALSIVECLDLRMAIGSLFVGSQPWIDFVALPAGVRTWSNNY